MTTDTQEPSRTWSANTTHVRKALTFIRRRKGGVTADELVAWDLANGRRLFTWDDPKAAEQFRLLEARLFMNRFRAMFDKMRVRAFIHVREDAEAGIDRSAYQTVEVISEHDGMRAQVVKDITKRMRMLASELAMWKLSDAERKELFDQLSDAMLGKKPATKAA